VTYAGQAAMRLEQVAMLTDRSYRWDVADGSPMVIDAAPVIDAIVQDRRRGVGVDVIAGAFHRSVAELIVDVAQRVAARTGIRAVALTGGVMQNRLLVELAVPGLVAVGLTPLLHGQVPPNDGGISLGQVAIGRAMLAGSIAEA
ncbi:MAG TPA: hypothetical protein VK866_02400, partial [Acidimicrobiales bacterium]|nr:hypothetical protein [Acidimicrobiales bacterium]